VQCSAINREAYVMDRIEGDGVGASDRKDSQPENYAN
jgi:hypothetical protein